jgi:hypothetical protein
MRGSGWAMEVGRRFAFRREPPASKGERSLDGGFVIVLRDADIGIMALALRQERA